MKWPKPVEAEQSSCYREYPVAFGQKREIVGFDQSDTANTLCRYCFQGTSVFGQKAPGAPVFGHCPFISLTAVYQMTRQATGFYILIYVRWIWLLDPNEEE